MAGLDLERSGIDRGPNFDSIDILVLIRSAFRIRFWLITAGTIGLISGYGFSHAKLVLYESQAKLAPVSASGSNSMMSNYSGIASLAGLSLPSSLDTDKTSLALAVLESRSFVAEFLTNRRACPIIVGAKSWLPESQSLALYADYTSESGQLVKPSDIDIAVFEEECIDRFQELFSVSQDSKTGFVSISLKHVSPVFARDLLLELITEINEEIRTRDITDANAAVKYLSEQSSTVQFAEIKEALFGLLQANVETAMFANVRSDYVFQLIDEPRLALNPVEPSRIVYALMGAISSILVLLGFFGGRRVLVWLSE